MTVKTINGVLSIEDDAAEVAEGSVLPSWPVVDLLRKANEANFLHCLGHDRTLTIEAIRAAVQVAIDHLSLPPQAPQPSPKKKPAE